MIIVYILITLILGFVLGFMMSARSFPSREVIRLLRTFKKEGFNEGEWKHYRELVDHNLKVIVKPNCETLYSTTFIDMKKGEYRLDVPASSEYFSVCFLNQKTETRAIITNQEISESEGSHFVLCTTPKNRNNEIELDKGICWIIVRFGLESEDALEKIHALQDQLKITPQWT